VRTVRAAAGAAYGVLAAADTALAAGGSLRARHVTKPLLLPLLAARVAVGPAAAGPRRTLAAQALSWGGDVALLGDGRRAFVTGLGSFLGAHVAYISAFRGRSSVPLLATPGRRRVLAGGAVAAVGMGLVAGRRDRSLAVPVAVYGVTLVSLLTAAAAVDPDRGRAQVLAGASSFVVSDTLIGVRRFVLDGPRPALDGAVMATYAVAQWCLCEGLSAGPRSVAP
jgi:uncharacterized membrane protein YhhN